MARLRLSTGFTRAMLDGHGLLGLSFGAVIYLLCLSGSLIVLVDQLTLWERPEAPIVREVSPAQLAQVSREGYARARAAGVAHDIYVTLPTPELPHFDASPPMARTPNASIANGRSTAPAGWGRRSRRPGWSSSSSSISTSPFRARSAAYRRHIRHAAARQPGDGRARPSPHPEGRVPPALGRRATALQCRSAQSHRGVGAALPSDRLAHRIAARPVGADHPRAGAGRLSRRPDARHRLPARPAADGRRPPSAPARTSCR